MEDARIKALLGIHRVGPAALDSHWTDVEASLHLELPYSYKRMVDLFGASHWANFLQILSPFDASLNLHEIGERILQADRTTRQSYPHHYPLPLFPEPGGLLPWAATDNGDALYFVTIADANDWPTVVKRLTK